MMTFISATVDGETPFTNNLSWSRGAPAPPIAPPFFFLPSRERLKSQTKPKHVTNMPPAAHPVLQVVKDRKTAIWSATLRD